jgi:hypothetical protein
MTGGPGGPARDPIAAHVAALDTALRGPARLKARMLTEVRDGLADAAADLAGDGPGDANAARRAAVRDFGTVAEVAPSFQRELTLAQARDTARFVAVAAPVLIGCWWLLGRGGDVPSAARVLAAQLGGVAAVAALLAVAALAVTGAAARRLPVPRRLPLVVAWTGTAAAVALGVGALALAAAAVATGNAGLAVLLGALTLASHTAVAASARACRHCARLAS